MIKAGELHRQAPARLVAWWPVYQDSDASLTLSFEVEGQERLGHLSVPLVAAEGSLTAQVFEALGVAPEKLPDCNPNHLKGARCLVDFLYHASASTLTIDAVYPPQGKGA